MNTLILSVDDLRAIVDHVGLNAIMDALIERLEAVCLDYDSEVFEVPALDGLGNGLDGLLEWMPVMHKEGNATIKIVGYHPDNPRQQNLPTILSVALSFDPTTGHLKALSDATFATALRTGAASALASKVLAHPRSARLSLIGAGAQALSQLHALSRVFELKEVLVFDVIPAVSASFASRAASVGLRGIEVRVVPPEVVTAGADILCTATSVGVGDGPVFADADLPTHLHVNAVGSDFPGKTELPDTLLKRSFVAVDFLAQARKEGESQRLAPHEIGPDLIQLVRGADQYAAYRKRASVFDSTGFALEDHVVIELLHAYARELGCGTECQIEGNATDPLNPYGFLSMNVDGALVNGSSSDGISDDSAGEGFKGFINAKRLAPR